MKRPILGLLAAATLSFGVVGTAPARAAAPAWPSSPAATPAHDHDRDDHKYTRRHGHDHDDHHGHDDHDGDRHRRPRRCEGKIVVCLF